MGPLVAIPCARCGRACAAEERVCALCGSLLRNDASAAHSTVHGTPTCSAPTPSYSAPAPSPSAPPTSFDRVSAALAERERRERESSRRAPWGYLALGLATAPIFAWTPVLQSMGWFLASLVHEMGHAALAWTCGMPAIPAISPAGHAAAVHGEQSTVLALLVLAGALCAAWKLLEGSVRVVAIAFVAIVQPTLAFTGVRELAFLLAGHAGELAFATLCLWKALDGGFTSSRLERALYGTLGWFLVGRNVLLCAGLVTSPSARAHYASNGSFGLTNDYIRAAEDLLGWRLESLALLMLAASVAAVPAAILLWRVWRSPPEVRPG